MCVGLLMVMLQEERGGCTIRVSGGLFKYIYGLGQGGHFTVVYLLLPPGRGRGTFLVALQPPAALS